MTGGEKRGERRGGLAAINQSGGRKLSGDHVSMAA